VQYVPTHGRCLRLSHRRFGAEAAIHELALAQQLNPSIGLKYYLEKNEFMSKMKAQVEKYKREFG
jgi:hypothetical protein